MAFSENLHEGIDGVMERYAPGEVGASVIWLHGLGADGGDFEGIVPYLGLPSGGPGIRFLFPNAPKIPVSVNGGISMRAWYDVFDQRIEFRADLSGMRHSARAVLSLVESEVAKGIPYSKIIVGGFSQGGLVAAFAGHLSPQPLGGAMILSSYIPAPFPVGEGEIPKSFLMAHGTLDQVVPVTLGRKSCEWLVEAGWKGSFHEYEMAHSVCIEELSEIGRWISGVVRE
jgi:phospholipase/carboxylesterase